MRGVTDSVSLDGQTKTAPPPPPPAQLIPAVDSELPLFKANGFDDDDKDDILVSSPPRRKPMPLSPLPRSRSHPPPPSAHKEVLDPITFTSSAPQPTPKRKPTVIEIADSDDEDDDLVQIHVPTPTKRKREEKGKEKEAITNDNKRARTRTKSVDNSGLDLDSIEVLDLSQGNVRVPSNKPDTGNKENGASSKSAAPPASPKPKITAPTAPVFFDSDWDDSLLNGWEGPTPGRSEKKKTKEPEPFLVSSDDDFDFGIEKPKPADTATKSTTGMSASTLRILEELRSKDELDALSDSEDEGSQNRSRKSKSPAKKVTSRTTTAGSSTASSRNRLTEDKVRRVEERATKDHEKNSKAAEKVAQKAAKEREKAAKQAEKEAEKARKQAEKDAMVAAKKKEQEINSLNKLKTSKKDSAPEMIVDLSTAFFPSEFGEQIVSFVKKLGSEVNRDWSPGRIQAGWRVVKWRRKKKATYDEEKAIFVPLPQMEICDEKHILVHLTATEFADLAYPESPDVPGTMDLDQHVAKMKELIASDGRVIYLIEGVAAYARKAKNAINAAHRSQVNAAMGARARPVRPPPRLITEDMLEDAQLRLQVQHQCLIHVTAAPIESAEWITVFTGDISTIPYKTSRMVLDTSFCTAVGQVRAGADREDTWSKMLQEIQRVTPAHANGIIDRCPDVRSLVQTFRQGGPEALHDIPLLMTRDGAPSNRNIGVATSRRIHGVFTERNAMAYEDSL
jgi:crossover junction endonuclease EME1